MGSGLRPCWWWTVCDGGAGFRVVGIVVSDPAGGGHCDGGRGRGGT